MDFAGQEAIFMHFKQENDDLICLLKNGGLFTWNIPKIKVAVPYQGYWHLVKHEIGT